MEYNIGDTVRIISDPNTLLFEGGDYEIGDIANIATIEAIEFNNGHIWYELDVELFDSDQVLWCEKNLELVKVADTTSKYRPGDAVVLCTEAGQPTKVTISTLKIGLMVSARSVSIATHTNFAGKMKIAGGTKMNYMTTKM